MPFYHVYGHVVGTKYLGKFEADTKEEAITKGLEGPEAHISLCHSCNDEIEVEIEDASAELVRGQKRGKK